MSNRDGLTILSAEPVDVQKIVQMHTALYREVVPAGVAVDVEKGVREILDVLNRGVGWIVYDERDELAGSIGLFRTEWWFATGAFYWTNLWWFVRPDMRSEAVNEMIMEEVRWLAEDQKEIVRLFADRNTPQRARSQVARVGESLRYIPAGPILQISPTGGPGHVRQQQIHTDDELQ